MIWTYCIRNMYSSFIFIVIQVIINEMKLYICFLFLNLIAIISGKILRQLPYYNVLEFLANIDQCMILSLDFIGQTQQVHKVSKTNS